MTTSDPLVSVVIPSLPSREKVRKRAIASVKAQTYENLEIIVETGGNNACEARNNGIKQAKGVYIALLDDDDTWEPTKIEKQVDYLEEHKDVPLVICFSNDLRMHDGRISSPPRIIDHAELIKGFNLSSTSSYMVRWHALELVKENGNYFDPRAPSGHEYDLALRITKQIGDIHCIQEILMTQYKTAGQISENWGRKVRGQYYMMEKWGKEYTIIEYLKRIGLVGLFWLGYFFGDLIMIPINKAKEWHEDGSEKSKR